MPETFEKPALAPLASACIRYTLMVPLTLGSVVSVGGLSMPPAGTECPDRVPTATQNAKRGGPPSTPAGATAAVSEMCVYKTA